MSPEAAQGDRCENLLSWWWDNLGVTMAVLKDMIRHQILGQILTSMSTPREDMASVARRANFMPSGGSNDSGVLNSIEIFDPETQSQ